MSEIEVLEEDLRIGSRILEWEIGDIWGHVGVRLPENNGVAVKLFRTPDDGDKDNWIVHFDRSRKKLYGAGGVPGEAAIYTEIFKARPDIDSVVHTHAPMCITLSMANKQIDTIHIQSKQYAGGVPIFPKPIFIIDGAEGAELAETMGQAVAVVIRGHGIVTVGKTIKEACINALYLERTAKMQAIANMLGFEKPDDGFMQEMKQSVEKLRNRVGKRRRGAKDNYALEWNYYKRKVEKGEFWSRGWV